MKIAFVSYRKQEKYSVNSPKDEDKVLLTLFASKGLHVKEVIWNDAAVNWADYDHVVLKSPWDYHEYFSEFKTWLAHLKDLNISLLNPDKIVQWNLDKHYLIDIGNSGLAVIDCAFFEKDSAVVLSDFFRKFNSQKLIIKPCVSASARNTMLVTTENVSERQQLLNKLLQEESFIVQPFIEEIHEGELSFIFLGGKYSHGVKKLPKPDDFRVQHFHGGTVMKFEPDERLIQVAKKYVEMHAQGCLYARVDGLLIGGNFYLMELELIEPYLFLDSHPGAYERYYEALIEFVSE